MDKSYPLHAGARSALNITAVLCCLLIVGIPGRGQCEMAVAGA
jgi:hypothetical protein